MKKPASKNLDTVIHQLFDEFLKADKVLENPDLLSFMLKTIKHFGEIQDFKGMYKRYFIPKTNKYLVDLRKVINGSKFKKFITNEFVDLEENKNETLRLALVGLFHKYESFRKDLVRNLNEYLKTMAINIDIQEYTQNHYDFKLRENWKNSTLYEVSWICNRIKHDSSLPVSFEKPNQQIPSKFENLDSDRKIIITSSEFYSYCDSIYQYCHDLFQLFNQINLKIQLEDIEIDELAGQLIDLEIKNRIKLLNNRKN
jgi:hypothetical protein